MSNRNSDQNAENIIMDYLLDALQADNATVSNERNVNVLVRVLNAYQRNAEMYHRNMGELIHLLQSHMNPTTNNTSRQTTSPVNRRSNTYRPWYFTTHATTPTPTPLSRDLSDNAIPTTRNPAYSSSMSETLSMFGLSNSTRDRRLDNSEIDSEVTDITYSAEESETRCPISLEDFCVGESICRINICGHMFKRNALYRWFDNHISCPVCRTNILSAPINNNTIQNNASRNNIPIIENNLINDYAQSIANSLLASLNTNPSNVGTYTFDIPLMYYDISRNVQNSGYDLSSQDTSPNDEDYEENT